METVTKFFSGILQGFWKNVVYSVEHMTVTQWCILGTTSVVIGFRLLRSTNR